MLSAKEINILKEVIEVCKDEYYSIKYEWGDEPAEYFKENTTDKLEKMLYIDEKMPKWAMRDN